MQFWQMLRPFSCSFCFWLAPPCPVAFYLTKHTISLNWCLPLPENTATAAAADHTSVKETLLSSQVSAF